MAEIRIITEPRVYVIGCSAVIPSEMDRFLADEGVPRWTTDTENGGEILIENGGRLCYMSHSKARPGGNRAYVEHLLECRHGCYDAETDVLTAAGWKKWPEVVGDDLLATRDTNGFVRYQRPTGLVSYHHTGRMYRVDSRCVDLLVTPNHNMFVCPTTTKHGRLREDYRLIRADELGCISHAYCKDARWEITGPRRECSPLILALIGFTVGDGYVHGRTVEFHLRRPRKIAWLANLCARLGWILHEERDTFSVSVPCGLRDLFNAVYTRDGEKQIPPGILTSCDSEQLQGLYEGLIESDGHQSPTGDYFDTTSQILVGQFQQLCLHIGVAAHINYTYGPDRRVSSFGTKPLTRICVIRRELRPEVNKVSHSVGRSYWIEDWSGSVYCAEVPNHTLYVRRNGIPVWCGNSCLEHATYTLILTGISRRCCEQITRHRVGWSPSQLSQRFVDEVAGGPLEVVLPPGYLTHYEVYLRWIESGRPLPSSADGEVADRLGFSDSDWASTNLICGWRNVVEKAACVYESHAEKLFRSAHIPDKTLRRKRAREAARSVLPNCAETKIQITCNARSLRHWIELRGSEAADLEINRVACKVFEVVRALTPNLFADYVVTPNPDGTRSIVTDNRKV